jgi:galactokinase
MTDLVSQLDAALDLRVVGHFYKKLHGKHPAGYWHAPGAITLLGDDGAALAMAVRWGAITAVEPRNDDTIMLRSINRLGEKYKSNLADLAPDACGVGATTRDWVVEPLAVLWAMREAGHRFGGATVTVMTDIPRDSGPAVSVAVACATVLAFRDLYGLDIRSAESIELVGRALSAFFFPVRGPGVAAASLLLDRGMALTRDTQDTTHEYLPLDLESAGLRLLIIDTRVRQGSAEMFRTNALDVDERDLVQEAVAILRRGDAAGLGPLLTSAHSRARDAGRTSVEQNLAVTTAVAAGALGARAIADRMGRPAIVLVRTDRVAAVRSSIVRAFGASGWRSPRFVTSAAVRRAGRIAGPSTRTES